MSQSTQPAEDTPGLPIRSLSVEVVDGEAKGARAEGAAESLSVGSAEGNDLVIADPTAPCDDFSSIPTEKDSPWVSWSNLTTSAR